MLVLKYYKNLVFLINLYSYICGYLFHHEKSKLHDSAATGIFDTCCRNFLSIHIVQKMIQGYSSLIRYIEDENNILQSRQKSLHGNVIDISKYLSIECPHSLPSRRTSTDISYFLRKHRSGAFERPQTTCSNTAANFHAKFPSCIR